MLNMEFDERLRPSIARTYESMRKSRTPEKKEYDPNSRVCNICQNRYDIEDSMRVIYFKEGNKTVHWYCRHCFEHRSRVSRMDCTKIITDGKNLI